MKFKIFCTAQNPQNLRNLGNIPYANFIFAGFALSAIYALVYALMRACLIFHTFGNDAFSDISRFGKMFKMGFVLDMRIVCVVFAVFILLGLFALLNKFTLAKFTSCGGGGKNIFINSHFISARWQVF